MKNAVFLLLMMSSSSFASSTIVCTGGVQDATSNVAVIDQVVSPRGKILESDSYYFLVTQFELQKNQGIHIELKRKTSAGNEMVASAGTPDGEANEFNYAPSMQEFASISCKKL